MSVHKRFLLATGVDEELYATHIDSTNWLVLFCPNAGSCADGEHLDGLYTYGASTDVPDYV